MSRLSSDAIPFDIPETESAKENKEPKEETKEKNEEKETVKNKKKKRSKCYDSESDTDSDSSDDFPAPKNIGTYIAINKGKNIHIGNNYEYTQINTAISKLNFTGSTSEVKSEYKCTESEKCLSEDLIKSVRGINSEDIYKVAEHISVDWKKLGRFLPPGEVFSEGQLKTFEANNPNNLVEAVVDMLNEWKDKYPEYSTVGRLAKALCKIKKAHIAEKLNP